MKTNIIYNENCFDTMEKHINRHSINVILTSPPYNTTRTHKFYDVYKDDKTDEEYIDWSISLFDAFEQVLAENGVVIYNINYGAEKNVNLLWKVVYHIIEYTDFMIADQIVWKKPNCLPNNMSPNKLSRIFENVFIFVRKKEYDTFQSNKIWYPQTQRHSNIQNWIEAKNNDGPTELNKATFSSELVVKLLQIYAQKGNIVYDPFMGTGTTAVGIKRIKAKIPLSYIGSELSKAQCKYAEERLTKSNKLF